MMEQKIDYSADAAVAVGGYSLVLLLLPVITLGLVAVAAVVDDVADAVDIAVVVDDVAVAVAVVDALLSIYFVCVSYCLFLRFIFYVDVDVEQVESVCVFDYCIFFSMHDT